MGDKITSQLFTESPLTRQRYVHALNQACEAFFAAVAASLPECTTGDLAPDADVRFQIVAGQTILAWYAENYRPTVATASVCMTVELRAPRQGERAYWAFWDRQTSTAQSALAELMAEASRDGEIGWVASRDHEESEVFDDTPEGLLRLVTITFKPEGA